ncbi:tetratricopeptide repeat protein [Methylobrevis albus]|uniref:Sel1 repeat family protein n=1 Tax=Methylobrevis albus TaxID=2793297 RepID=A0A931MZI8_9HYPH|nr:sel1 repeat family protein [Methylobrevis albus]MBH0238119.1 sel1 repeat family protein [Methylobrevis albus]
MGILLKLGLFGCFSFLALQIAVPLFVNLMPVMFPPVVEKFCRYVIWMESCRSFGVERNVEAADAEDVIDLCISNTKPLGTGVTSVQALHEVRHPRESLAACERAVALLQDGHKMSPAREADVSYGEAVASLVANRSIGVHKLLRVAERGDGRAALTMFHLKYFGIGEDPDTRAALKWLVLAALYDLPDAYAELGRLAASRQCIGVSGAVDGDVEQLLEARLQEVVETAGPNDVTMAAGNLLESNGSNTSGPVCGPGDSTSSRGLYAHAAQLGSLEGMFELAIVVRREEGDEAAGPLFERALSNMNPDYPHDLGWKGHAYRFGYGVEADLDAAVKVFLEAAEAGDLYSYLALAEIFDPICYTRCEPVLPVNSERAATYAERSSDGMYVRAMVFKAEKALGSYLVKNSDVETNVDLLTQASFQGSIKASEMLGDLFSGIHTLSMGRVKEVEDPKRALQFYWRAASAGNCRSMNRFVDIANEVAMTAPGTRNSELLLKRVEVVSSALNEGICD